jgi:hypothetical protein
MTLHVVTYRMSFQRKREMLYVGLPKREGAKQNQSDHERVPVGGRGVGDFTASARYLGSYPDGFRMGSGIEMLVPATHLFAGPTRWISVPIDL